MSFSPSFKVQPIFQSPTHLSKSSPSLPPLVNPARPFPTLLNRPLAPTQPGPVPRFGHLSEPRPGVFLVSGGLDVCRAVVRPLQRLPLSGWHVAKWSRAGWRAWCLDHKRWASRSAGIWLRTSRILENASLFLLFPCKSFEFSCIN